MCHLVVVFFFSSRRRHTRCSRDWSSDVCSSDLLGGRGGTFSGLAGAGDLILTCTGALSRNRSVGIEVGRGRRLDEVLQGMRMVAEGVATTRAAVALARRQGVELPIAQKVHQVLFEAVAGREAGADLLGPPLREEAWSIC